MKTLFSILLLTLLSACALRVKTTINNLQPALSVSDSVYVLGVKAPAPANFIEVGTVSIGDKGTSTNCKWNVGIAQAKLAAKKVGGNVLKITDFKPYGHKSTCDRFTATIYKVTSEQELKKISNLAKEKKDTTWNYAKLYLFRPKNGVGQLISYDIHLNKMVIGRVKNNWKQEYIITEEGPSVLWAKTEVKKELIINVEHGKEYYVYCGIGLGVFVGQPILQQVEHIPGEAAYNNPDVVDR